MTIDEIIANEKEIADMLYDQQRSHSAHYHKQLAELLEELKFRRVLQIQCEKEFFSGYEKGKKEGYNKAIDDFAEKLIRISDTLAVGNDNTRKYLILHFKEIAEQLKAGGAE